MLRPLVAGCLLLGLGSIASSQSGTPSEEAPSPMELLAPASIQPPQTAASAAKPDAAKKAKAESVRAATNAGERTIDYLAQCLRDWDAGTHMTKQEWARTCRRVANNRTEFLRKEGFLREQGK